MSLIGRFPHSHSEASSLLSKRFSGETVQKLVKENRVDLPDTAICPCIKNIVATLNLGVKIDLKVLAKKCKNTEYNPKRFTAAIIRLKEPKTTALAFSTGKMVVTGAKSEDNCKSAARTFAKMVRRCGFEVAFKQFKIQNVVGVADVNFQIRLEALQMQHKQFCQYEPEVFPGAIYRLMQPKVVLLIFVSGRVVITGAKGREDTKKSV
jgi:transcription initiation factor TFIID TATA-box-binding protein